MKQRFFSLIIAVLAWTVSRTVHLRAVREDQVEKIRSETGKGVILATWHGRTLLPITRFHRRSYWAMISTSRDGEYQYWIFKRFGFNIVRGSSSARGAVEATLKLIKALKGGGVLAHTPDGPRGPSRSAHTGTVYLAMKSGCPIIPVGIGASSCKLLNTWDQYMIPMPFSKAVMLYGDPIYIPSDAKSEEEQQHWTQVMGERIDALEAEAERMVGRKVPTAQSAGAARR
ncbi:MAG: lysophospholipid acyltransferase family protein [Capsulimonas sp.]|uniref:lysophospholipid acyltransferase family protein n=1 Tax=Capsulimonas sp. TaxID=2494211 RepID=UPI003264BAD4